jgi:hypothetical protein
VKIPSAFSKLRDALCVNYLATGYFSGAKPAPTAVIRITTSNGFKKVKTKRVLWLAAVISVLS